MSQLVDTLVERLVADVDALLDFDLATCQLIFKWMCIKYSHYDGCFT